MENFFFHFKPKGVVSEISVQTHSCDIPILTFHPFASSDRNQKAETEVNRETGNTAKQPFYILGFRFFHIHTYMGVYFNIPILQYAVYLSHKILHFSEHILFEVFDVILFFIICITTVQCTTTTIEQNSSMKMCSYRK